MQQPTAGFFAKGAVQVDDVILPPWANNSAFEFIHLNDVSKGSMSQTTSTNGLT